MKIIRMKKQLFAHGWNHDSKTKSRDHLYRIVLDLIFRVFAPTVTIMSNPNHGQAFVFGHRPRYQY